MKELTRVVNIQVTWVLGGKAIPKQPIEEVKKDVEKAFKKLFVDPDQVLVEMKDFIVDKKKSKE